MKKPIIYSKGVATSTDAMVKPTPIFSQGDYDVYVGALEDDKLPTYVVINRTTDVVEFTTEITVAYLSWLRDVENASKQIAAFTAKELSGDQQLNFNLAN